MNGYTQLLETVGKTDTRKRMFTLSQYDFRDGLFVLGFQLESDLKQNLDYWVKERTGSLRIDLKFDRPLLEPINVILQATFPRMLQIDSARNVSTS